LFIFQNNTSKTDVIKTDLFQLNHLKG